MWSVSGSYKGIDYVVRGEAATVRIDEPELTSFKAALALTHGVLSERVTGPHIVVDLTDPSDVVRMLLSMTDVDEIVDDGSMPREPVIVLWSDDEVVY